MELLGLDMTTSNKKTVLVIGASDKPDRYSNKAIVKLKASGYKPIGIHPMLRVAEGAPVYASLSEVPAEDIADLHSVTMYVNPALSSKMLEELQALKPPRVIWNPGSENPEVQAQLEDSSIHNLEACTLVLLSTSQFEQEF